MQKQSTSRLVLSALALLLTPSLLYASTTVTVDDNNRVTIDQNQVQPAVIAVVDSTPQIVVVEEVKDPNHVEGEITRVDTPANEILVRTSENREKRILLKQGMIGTYKVGDYVDIQLRNGINEAKTIKTQGPADLEGEVVAVDTTRNLITVRDEKGNDHVVLVSAAMNGQNKVGDRVRLYVVSDTPTVREVRLIRVR